MLPDLKSFQGHNTDQIIARLNADGYQEIDSLLYRSPDAGHMVRLSNAPDLMSAFCKACQGGRKNEFLPRIFDHAVVAPGLHVSVTENLLSVKDFEAATTTTVFGHARAVSSMFEGDEMHAVVHRCMASDPAMRAAILKIANCALGTKAPVTLNPRGETILFRHDENGCRTVFANPLLVRENLSAKACAQHLNWVKKRFSKAERDAPSSAYWYN